MGDGTRTPTRARNEDQVGVGRIGKEGTGSEAQRTEARRGDCLIATTAGTTGRKSVGIRSGGSFSV
jgi:hypothetical protein